MWSFESKRETVGEPGLPGQSRRLDMMVVPLATCAAGPMVVGWTLMHEWCASGAKQCAVAPLSAVAAMDSFCRQILLDLSRCGLGKVNRTLRWTGDSGGTAVFAKIWFIESEGTDVPSRHSSQMQLAVLPPCLFFMVVSAMWPSLGCLQSVPVWAQSLLDQQHLRGRG